MPEFSIIVPIYNAEKTLRRCLQSLKDQARVDFEVLMVENGSSDGSGRICREFAGTDDRFRLLVCGENLGPSGARNIGLDQARGQWVAFVDSDDFVEPDYLASLGRSFEAQAADVVFFGYRQISIDGAALGEHIPQIPGKPDYHETLVQLSRQDMFGYTWIKAFRRDAIGPHRFSTGLNLLEDEVFTCEVLTEQKKIGILPKPIYNYVTGNAGSLVGRTHPDYCRKLDTAYRAWKVLLNGSGCAAEALGAMANAHVDKCRYYGFERDLDPEEFFRSLAESEFFREATLDSKFTRRVRAGQFGSLKRMRWVYRMKAAAARVLKK